MRRMAGPSYAPHSGGANRAASDRRGQTPGLSSEPETQFTLEGTMSGKDKKIDDMPEKKLDNTAADQVRGGFDPVNSVQQPVQPLGTPKKV